jgi:hypothetical protein
MTLPPSYPPHDAATGPHTPYGAPAWQGRAPTWEQPAPVPPFPAPVQPTRNRGLVIALVAAGGALVGAVVAGLLVAVLFTAAAQDIGSGMGEEFSQSLEGGFGMMPEDVWSSQYGSGPVEEFPATPPGTLGPDPVLSAYANSCFDGEMQACDDLYYESPPMSKYEEYAVTCGGRVKQFAVMACTDLD